MIKRKFNVLIKIYVSAYSFFRYGIHDILTS
jgi:hypothetical protein